MAQAYNMDLERTADHLELPVTKIQAALAYAEAYPEEIGTALVENHRSFAELERLMPNIEQITVDAYPEHGVIG